MPTDAAVVPSPPRGLRAPGSGLWTAIVADLDPSWELDARETAALGEACKIADQLDRLDKAVAVEGATVRGSRGQTTVHPAIGEGRALRLAQLRLLGSIELVDPMAAVKAATPQQARARAAAQKRWAHRATLRGAG